MSTASAATRQPQPGPAGPPDVLAGFTVAVTSDRRRNDADAHLPHPATRNEFPAHLPHPATRNEFHTHRPHPAARNEFPAHRPQTAERDELATLLEARGARVVLAPALRLVPAAEDTQVREVTRRRPESEPDAMAAGTATGMLGWIEAPPVDPTPLQRLIDLITNHLVDAVTFTSAVAVGSVLHAAGPDREAVLTALRGPVLVGCVGPQAAEPLRRVGVPVLLPPRARVGALVALLVEALPGRTQTLQVAGCELVLRGHAAVVDGVLKPLTPAQMAILRSLAAAPGRVLPRSELLESLPRGADEHAVEMAVARLRAALGRPSFIQTVVKRGYRLRID